MNYYSVRITLNSRYFNDGTPEYMTAWMVENVGWYGFEWRMTYFMGYGYIYFKNDEDAMAFKLMFPETCQ